MLLVALPGGPAEGRDPGASADELQRLVGYINWVAGVVPGAKVFRAGLIIVTPCGRRSDESPPQGGKEGARSPVPFCLTRARVLAHMRARVEAEECCGSGGREQGTPRPGYSIRAFYAPPESSVVAATDASGLGFGAWWCRREERQRSGVSEGRPSAHATQGGPVSPWFRCRRSAAPRRLAAGSREAAV